ncbi:hypothetical protein B484DRAFT_454264 [Ochromonadaceae sp. CCMP2298]|nr:hypothetical protein B484DRAFT_454264 [Ochromonadaceae sp. CCMP2298]
MNGLVAWAKKHYFRYQLLTGVYVLTSTETAIINTLILITVAFIVRYASSFISQLYSSGDV